MRNVISQKPHETFFIALAEGKEDALQSELDRLRRIGATYQDEIWAIALAAAALSGKAVFCEIICDFPWTPDDLPERASVALSREPDIFKWLKSAKVRHPKASVVGANNLLLDLCRKRDMGDGLPMSNG